MKNKNFQNPYICISVYTCVYDDFVSMEKNMEGYLQK